MVVFEQEQQMVGMEQRMVVLSKEVALGGQSVGVVKEVVHLNQLVSVEAMIEKEQVVVGLEELAVMEEVTEREELVAMEEVVEREELAVMVVKFVEEELVVEQEQMSEVGGMTVGSREVVQVVFQLLVLQFVVVVVVWQMKVEYLKKVEHPEKELLLPRMIVSLVCWMT